MSFFTDEIKVIRESGAYDDIKDIIQIAVFNAFSKGYSLDDVTRMFNDTIHAQTFRFEVQIGVVALEDVSIVER